jgi:hypothetical protein
MAEPNNITFSFKEIATLMIKDQNIHQGYWGIAVRFGISATNAGLSEADIKPTAIVPIVDIGLQKFEELNNLSVDAAEVNPPNKPTSSKRGK